MGTHFTMHLNSSSLFPSLELKDELKGLLSIIFLLQGQSSELGLAQGPHPNLGRAPGGLQAVTSPVNAKPPLILGTTILQSAD